MLPDKATGRRLHNLGTVGGRVRVRMERCPVEVALEPDVSAAFDDYISTITLGQPLVDGGIHNLDNWTHEALLAIKSEEAHVRQRLNDDETKARGR